MIIQEKLAGALRIWLDSDNYAQKACQVGITGIEAGAGRSESRVKGWQFVFFLHDMVPGAYKSKKSLLFGDVVQGIDVVKSLSCSNLLTSHFSDGLRLILESKIPLYSSAWLHYSFLRLRFRKCYAWLDV